MEVCVSGFLRLEDLADVALADSGCVLGVLDKGGTGLLATHVQASGIVAVDAYCFVLRLYVLGENVSMKGSKPESVQVGA